MIESAIAAAVESINGWGPLALVLCCGIALWAAGFFDDIDQYDDEDEDE